MARGQVLHHPAVIVEDRCHRPRLAPRAEFDSAAAEARALDLDLDAVLQRMGESDRAVSVPLEFGQLAGEVGANALDTAPSTWRSSIPSTGEAPGSGAGSVAELSRPLGVSMACLRRRNGPPLRPRLHHRRPLLRPRGIVRF
jgi:hypothetical protein